MVCRCGKFGDEEISFLTSLLRDNSIVIEVGSFKGGSASLFLDSNKVDIIYCIDSWCRKHIERKFDKNVKKYVDDKKLNKIKIDSVEGSKIFDNGYADLIYIDAAHDYESVKRDILCYFPKLKSGGIMSGHDYITEKTDIKGRKDKHAGVKKAVDELFGKEINIYGWTWYLKKGN